VFCIEASRLARNGRDWHHLIYLCALVGTLVIDPDGTYDPRLVNDRLLRGLKGTMSEYELSLLRQRGWRRSCMKSELDKPAHLARKAVVYIRQSTPHQVREQPGEPAPTIRAAAAR
jgi:DNA invertase Pin-like site-specific DNA recombinase